MREHQNDKDKSLDFKAPKELVKRVKSENTKMHLSYAAVLTLLLIGQVISRSRFSDKHMTTIGTVVTIVGFVAYIFCEYKFKEIANTFMVEFNRPQNKLRDFVLSEKGIHFLEIMTIAAMVITYTWTHLLFSLILVAIIPLIDFHLFLAFNQY